MADKIKISKTPIILKDAAVSHLREGILRATLAPKRTSLNRAEYRSYLNTPVHGSFIFGDLSNSAANNYIDPFGETRSFTPLKFHECTFRVALTKNIIKTPLQGYNGTVKEYISDGDFEIAIDGVLSGVYNSITRSFEASSLYPEEYVRDLVAALKVPAAIPVSNNILSVIFEINYVVVANYVFSRDTAGMNYQRFSLNLISDRPIEIVLKEGDLENDQKLADLLGI